MTRFLLLFVTLLGVDFHPRQIAFHTTHQTYRKTTVCRILSLSQAGQATNVEVAANVLSDGMHGAILTDTKCPGRGLYLGVIQDDADASVLELQKALWSDGAPGTTGRKVNGIFFGRLRLNHRTKKVSITLVRVQNLVNVRTDGMSPADGGNAPGASAP